MQVATDPMAFQAETTAAMQRLVDRVAPDQLTDPTPCTKWDVRALLDHSVGLNASTLQAIRGEMPLDASSPSGDDPAATFAASARSVKDAFAAPGALDRTYQLPWGEMTGDALANMLAMDIAIHAWDLAKATGQPLPLEPGTCEAVLAMGREMMRPEYRTPESGFGPEVTVADDLPASDRMAAFFGRNP